MWHQYLDFNIRKYAFFYYKFAKLQNSQEEVSRVGCIFNFASPKIIVFSCVAHYPSFCCVLKRRTVFSTSNFTAAESRKLFCLVCFSQFSFIIALISFELPQLCICWKARSGFICWFSVVVYGILIVCLFSVSL